jgi:heme-degrading monooxygenase HmoA
MIGRFWRGWATSQHAQAYEELFRTSILPGLQRIDGFAGAYVLRKDAGEEVELMTITLFESLEAMNSGVGRWPCGKSLGARRSSSVSGTRPSI